MAVYHVKPTDDAVRWTGWLLLLDQAAADYSQQTHFRDCESASECAPRHSDAFCTMFAVAGYDAAMTHHSSVYSDACWDCCCSCCQINPYNSEYYYRTMHVVQRAVLLS